MSCRSRHRIPQEKSGLSHVFEAPPSTGAVEQGQYLSQTFIERLADLRA
jgi:hypothetical protein